MHLQCDYRESKCIEILKSLNVDFKTENLTIGDFVVSNNDNTHSVVIERKTMDDLSASIIDSRYKDQTNRLQKIQSSKVKILIIVESFHKTNQKGISYDSLLSSMISICIKYGFYIMRTKDTNETCKCIINVLNKIDSVKCLGEENQVNIIMKKEYTIVSVYKNMLCCIPGISITIANLINEKYPNMKSLLDSFNLKGMNALTEINKIGPKTSEKIYKYILSVSE